MRASVVDLVLPLMLVGPSMLILSPVIRLVPGAHQLYTANEVNQGVDYRYPVIPDLVYGDRRIA